MPCCRRTRSHTPYPFEFDAVLLEQRIHLILRIGLYLLAVPVLHAGYGEFAHLL